jgi:hypothetical protein
LFGATLPKGTRISKRIEVLSDFAQPYHVSLAEAKAITARKDGQFINSRQIRLTRSDSKRSEWTVRGPSAFYSENVAFGPKFGTLQLT